MSLRDRSPVKTSSPRQPSGKHHWNQLSLTIWLCSSWNLTAGSSGQRRTGPPTEPGFSQGFFSPFCHLWSFGSLPLSPLACLVGDTSFPAISSTWLNRNVLNWTELDDAITEFNNEMPLTENWVFNLVLTLLTHYFLILILCSCFDTICIVKSAI